MEQVQPTNREPLTVTELSRGLKRCFEDFFPNVWVKGEVKGFSCWRGRDWYFSIKDARSVLKCVMFYGRAQRMDWQPVDGDEVFLKGSLAIQNTKGEFRLDVKEVLPLGQGIHQRKVEALKRKLKAEGLLDPRRKRPLPRLPAAIGIVTSRSGAVLHDLRRGILDRFPGVTIFLASCRVEGPRAAGEVAAAIQLLGAHGGSEVIIVARGGGSRQTLAVFDEEVIARAIAAAPVPVISAVGHETDHSVADLVADVRAETPSRAAVLVVPVREELRRHVGHGEELLRRRMKRQLARHQTRLDHRRRLLRDPTARIAAGRAELARLEASLKQGIERDLLSRRLLVRVARERLRHPTVRIEDGRRRSTELSARLQEAMLRDLMGRQQLLRILTDRLQPPTARIEAGRDRVEALRAALHAAIQRQLHSRREQLHATTQHLDALSPLAVLARGYSLTLRGQQAVRSADELTPGEAVQIRFARGRATAVIATVEPEGAVEPTPETGESR